MMKIYAYSGCGTCKKALSYLKDNGLSAEIIPIRETPPSKAELRFMLEQYDGNIKRLFNISGQDYRALGLKDKIASMSMDDAIELLHHNGNLVKRPFLISDKKGLVGFSPDEWSTL